MSDRDVATKPTRTYLRRPRKRPPGGRAVEGNHYDDIVGPICRALAREFRTVAPLMELLAGCFHGLIPGLDLMPGNGVRNWNYFTPGLMWKMLRIDSASRIYSAGHP